MVLGSVSILCGVSALAGVVLSFWWQLSFRSTCSLLYCSLIYCNKYSILRNEFYKKIEHIIPNFKKLSPLQIIHELMTSSNHYINIQLAKFISSCFDLHNIQLSNQTNAT